MQQAPWLLQPPVPSTVATPAQGTGTADGSEDKPMPASVYPVQKKKACKQKSAHLVKDDEKAGPTQEEEEKEEEDQMLTYQSLSLNEP